MGEIRDAARTRQKIVEAASEEFSAKGFAGARMEGIAKRAEVNKQLVYHYFANKEALFSEILDGNIREKETLETPDDRPDLLFAQRFRMSLREPVWLRFVTWEAAEYPEKQQIIGEERRAQAIQNQQNALIARQFHGTMPKDFSARNLQLAMFALATYPLTFPQVTRMVTGRSPEDPAFQQEWETFLRELGSRLFGEQAAQPVKPAKAAKPAAKAAAAVSRSTAAAPAAKRRRPG